MLAERRTFTINGQAFETPMVIPSFSSRGFPDVKKIIAGAKEYITDETLISAYDLSYGLIPKDGWTFPTVIFVDSGGYETGSETDLSDHRSTSNSDAKRWTQDLYFKELEKWKHPRPSVFVSYDNPDRRVDFQTQVNRARKIKEKFPRAASEILLKAPRKATNKHPYGGFVEISHFHDIISQLIEFEIIGVTEKELGRSINERLQKVAKIRQILNSNDIRSPLHIFGSLDPITTPLYFLAGADIFDGLTWLRFAYDDEVAIYRHNFSALRLNHSMPEHTVNMTIHQRNHNVLMEMASKLKRFLNNHNYDVFDTHSNLFYQCMDEIQAELGGY